MDNTRENVSDGQEESVSIVTAPKRCGQLASHALVLAVCGGVVLGFGLGFLLRHVEISEDALMWTGLPGEVFMRMLKVVIVPVIVCSIIHGTATMDPRSHGRISLLSLGFVLLANSVGSLTGIVCYYIVRPGEGMAVSDEGQYDTISTSIQTHDMFADLIRNIVPDNILTVCFQKTQTRYDVKTELNSTNTRLARTVGTAAGTNVLVPHILDFHELRSLRISTPLEHHIAKLKAVQKEKQHQITDLQRLHLKTPTQLYPQLCYDIVQGCRDGVLFLSTVIGMAVSKMDEKGRIIVDLFEALSSAFIKILTWFMWSTPVGVASLIAVSVARVADIEDTFSSLGLLVVAFFTGILFQQLILFPVLLFILFRMNPLYFYFKAAKAWMAVFGPPSSAIGIPEILRICEEDFHVDKRVSRFTVPFGAAECRIGSAHFVILSVLFLAAAQGVSLNLLQVIIVWILCSLSSLALPAVPSSSLVVILILLTSIDVDGDAMGILLTLEWFTDRLRTTSNAMASTICTMTVDKFCKGKLEIDIPSTEKATEVDGVDSDGDYLDKEDSNSILLKIH